MQVRLPPSSESAQAARVAVTDFLVRLGRGDLTDDVTLIAAELVANAILHARTELVVSVDHAGDGVRITVADSSSILPRWTSSSPTSTAGRGLLLVERLSRRWGFEPLPGGGKTVWAEIDTCATYDLDRSPDELLASWPDEPWPALCVADPEVDVDVKIDVQAMLSSRAHTEELVRDLQLTLLNAANQDAPTEAKAQVVDLARRLDAANEDFHEARRQIYNQTISARRDHRTETTLRLRLRRSDGLWRGGGSPPSMTLMRARRQERSWWHPSRLS